MVFILSHCGFSFWYVSWFLHCLIVGMSLAFYCRRLGIYLHASRKYSSRSTFFFFFNSLNCLKWSWVYLYLCAGHSSCTFPVWDLPFRKKICDIEVYHAEPFCLASSTSHSVSETHPCWRNHWTYQRLCVSYYHGVIHKFAMFSLFPH